MNSFGEHNGMYAFSIYDKQKKETTIVRDKSGEKPLYYTKGKDFFAYASEMKCLLELVEPKFNYEAVSYDAYEFTVGKETPFLKIYINWSQVNILKLTMRSIKYIIIGKFGIIFIDIPDNEEKNNF